MELLSGKQYHCAMKRFFLGLLVTLTVLRGFVGDVMATEMSAMMTAPSSEHVMQAESAQHAMPCHSAEEDDLSAGTSSGCKTCQVCHLSAFVSPSVASVPQSMLHSNPMAIGESFASAEPLQLAKPPIS